MKLEPTKNILIKILILSGLCVSILSLLEPHIAWISSFCGVFGDGCKDTIQFTFFQLPVSLWGIFFYITLLLASFLHRPSLFWLTIIGTGIEFGLIKAMFIQNFFCFLCILNLIVIILLFILIIKKTYIWQTLTLIFFFFIVTDIFLYKADDLIVNQTKHLSGKTVLAIVDGSIIHDNDIEKSIAGQLNKLEKKIYQIKRKNLNKQIEKVILDKEAKRQNISPAKLITNLLSTVKKITDDEIESHYLQHKDYYDKQKKSKDETKIIIRSYLQEKRLSQKIKSYVNPLKIKYNVKDFLYPPRMPSTEIRTENNYFQGPANAKVSIIVFSDYLCPSCQRAHKLISTIKEEYKGKIKWIFKDYPLKRHKGAKRLAAAARSAGEQGKFWEYQDLLFSSKQKPDDSKLLNFAEKLELNINLFNDSLNSKKHLPLIEKDIQDALASGIRSTPTFIINGKVNSGTPTLAEFRGMIDKELK